MDKQQSLLLKKYIDLLLRWKVLFILLLLISLPVGLVFYVLTPKVYEASSLLSYQQQSVSPNKMSPDVSARIQDIVSTLTQIIISRTNLEGLITSFDLYGKQRAKLPMEDVIDLMRKDIRIEPSRRGDTFSISFSGGDPGKVVKIANALAAKFIEENLKYREERASETSSYTGNELEMAKATMDRMEASMRDYKLKYYNEMPEQRLANMARLTSLQEQYQGKQESLLELERTRVLVQEQIGIRGKVRAAETTSLGKAEPDYRQKDKAAGETSYQKLQRMRRALESLLVTYTESHPEVKRVKKIIAKLEEDGAGTEPVKESSARRSPGVDKDTLQLQSHLKKIDLDVEAIELEKKQIDKTMKQYEEWIAATPVREAEWSALTREYGQLKSHYDYLVSQNLQAKSMLNLERRQKGSQFKIEDPARFPEKPDKPNFLMVMAISVAAAMTLGLGTVLTIDFLDGSFRDPDDIELFLGIPVVSSIAFVSTPGEKRKDVVVSSGVVLILLLGMVVVAGLFWYVWSQGKIVI